MAELDELFQEENPYQQEYEIDMEEIEPELILEEQENQDLENLEYNNDINLGLEEQDLLEHEPLQDNQDPYEEILNTKTAPEYLKNLKKPEKEKIKINTKPDLLTNAEHSRKIINQEKTVNNVLTQAENSHIIANAPLTVKGEIGRHSTGSVLAAQHLQTQKPLDQNNTPIITTSQSPQSDQVTTFTGDWTKLEHYLTAKVPQEKFQFQQNFPSFSNPQLKNHISSITELDKDLTVLNTINNLEIPVNKPVNKEKIYQTFRDNENEFYPLTEKEEFPEIVRRSPHFKQLSDKQLPTLIQEIEHWNRTIEQEGRLVSQLAKQVKPRGISTKMQEKRKENAQRLYQEDAKLLRQLQETYEAGDFLVEASVVLETETEMTTTEFINKFAGGATDKVLLENFETQSTTEKYEEGVEKLESLARIEGNYQTQINYNQLVQNVLDEYTAEINLEKIQQAEEDTESILFGEELNQLIGQYMQEDPETGQQLVEKRNQLKKQIEQEKRRKAFQQTIENTIQNSETKKQIYRELEDEDPDFSHLKEQEVSEMLQELSEQHLDSNNSAYHDAQTLAQQINPEDKNNVEFEIYDKSLENMPYKENRELPCTFPGSDHATAPTFLNYMLDPATQVGKIKTEKGEGVALMKLVEHEGEDFLYMHSVEADKGTNLASNHETATQIQNHIEQYAEQLTNQTIKMEDQEINLDGIMYSMDKHNQGTAQAFQDTVYQNEQINETQVQEAELNQHGVQHFGFDHKIENGVEVYKKHLTP